MSKKIPKRYSLFSQKRILEAIKNGKMLSIGLNTSPTCKLNCIYCFNEECDPKDTMDWKTRKKVIDEAVELGVEEIVIPGKGEPFEDPNIDKTIKYIFDKGIRLEIFTSGLRLEKKHIKWFRETPDSCITIKYLAVNPAVQDYLAGLKGYAKILEKKVKLLKDAKFEEGRVSFSTQITTINIEEIPEVYKMCRIYGFIPYLARLLKKGRAEQHPELFPTSEQLERLSQTLLEIDKSLGYDLKGFNPIFGKHKCQFIYYSPYVEFDGNVYPCIGRTRLISSLKERSFQGIWEEIVSFYKRIPSEMKGYCAGCKSLKEFICYGCLKENSNATGSELMSKDYNCPSSFTGRKT